MRTPISMSQMTNYEVMVLTFGNASCSNATSITFGTTLGVWQMTNIIVIAIDALVIRASRFLKMFSPPWLLKPSGSFTEKYPDIILIEMSTVSHVEVRCTTYVWCCIFPHSIWCCSFDLRKDLVSPRKMINLCVRRRLRNCVISLKSHISQHSWRCPFQLFHTWMRLFMYERTRAFEDKPVINTHPQHWQTYC